MATIQLKNVFKRYDNGFEAVKDFNLDIQDKEFIIFVILSTGGLLINQGIMWLGVNFFEIYYLAVKIFAMIFVPVYNFVTRKIFLEKTKKNETFAQPVTYFFDEKPRKRKYFVDYDENINKM